MAGKIAVPKKMDPEQSSVLQDTPDSLVTPAWSISLNADPQRGFSFRCLLPDCILKTMNRRRRASFAAASFGSAPKQGSAFSFVILASQRTDIGPRYLCPPSVVHASVPSGLWIWSLHDTSKRFRTICNFSRRMLSLHFLNQVVIIECVKFHAQSFFDIGKKQIQFFILNLRSPISPPLVPFWNLLQLP